MVNVMALVTGASAIFFGIRLLNTWLRHGGASGASHFKPLQILGHAAVGILAVVSVIIHLAAGSRAACAAKWPTVSITGGDWGHVDGGRQTTRQPAYGSQSNSV